MKLNDRKKTYIGIAALVVVLGLAAFRVIPGLRNLTQGTQTRQPLEEMTIAVASDVHYIAPELTDNGTYFTDMINQSDGKDMFHAKEILDAFAQQVIEEAPQVLIISGDLTFNGAKASHEALAQKLAEIENTGIQVLVIPGNHDIECRMAARFEGDQYTFVENVTGEEFAEIYRANGYEEAIARDADSLSYTYELQPGLWALMVDTNTAAAPGRITDETLRWVEGQLKETSKQGISVIGISHQNLLNHNSLFTDGYVIGGHEKLQALYEKYGVLYNLSGHMHIQHVAESEPEKSEGTSVTEILTSSLMVSPNQFGVIKMQQDGCEYHTVEVEFEHQQEAADLMWRLSRRSAEGRSEAAVEEGQTPLSENAINFFARVNTAYFAGRTDRIEWDEEAAAELSQGYSLTGVYLQTVQQDGFRDCTKAQILFEH